MTFLRRLLIKLLCHFIHFIRISAQNTCHLISGNSNRNTFELNCKTKCKCTDFYVRHTNIRNGLIHMRFARQRRMLRAQLCIFRSVATSTYTRAIDHVCVTFHSTNAHELPYFFLRIYLKISHVCTVQHG